MKKKLLVLLMAVAIIGCGKKKEVTKEVPVRPVKSILAMKESSELQRNFSGTIKAETESNLSFRVPGKILKKHVKLGDDVKKGEVLAVLDSIDYEVKYQSSIASLEEAKAGLVRDQSDFERVQKLYFNDNVSKSEYDSSLALFKSSKAKVEAAQKQVEYDKLQLGYTRLISPANGSIAEELSEENENVAAGTPVYLMSVSGNLEVDFFVPESMISKIKSGTSIEVIADAAKDKKTMGIISQVGSVSTGFGKTFPVKAKLVDPSDNIKSGMTAQVRLNLDFADDNVILVPLQSVVTDEAENKYVLVVDNISSYKGTVKKVFVKTGKVTNKGIEITEGLHGGETVISAGMSKVAEGQSVEVLSKGVN